MPNWEDLAKDAFYMATSFADTNYRKNWNDSEQIFQNKHPKGSKYYTTSYKYRSKIFRPKTRTSIRKTEAAAYVAFFSSLDSIYINAVDDSKEEDKLGAEILRNILSYRLNSQNFPWFLLCMGAIQDAQKHGVVCSCNEWKVDAKITKEPVLDAIGEPLFRDGIPVTEDVKEVIKSGLDSRIIPIEQLLIHPGADWLDPINSSPFVIEKIPMYVYEVKARMKQLDNAGQPKWKIKSTDEILKARIHERDITDQVRQEQREEPTDVKPLSEYDMVWIHRCFFYDENGQDYVFYTLHDQGLLTDPKPRESFPQYEALGERPYSYGYFILESHKSVPVSVPMISKGLQVETNDIANSRLDNVKLVLNKRWFAKRGAQVDLKSLTRNAAGSVTLMSDPNSDVVAQDFDDVTSSSYAEQDRINLDHDDLVGNFSQSSVQSNRSMNETVGGMSMLTSAAGQMTDYGLKTYSETWLEKTIRQFVKLIQNFEVDEDILHAACNKAKAAKRLNVEEIDTETIISLIKRNFLVSVDVGVGATNPALRLEKFLLAITKFAEISQTMPPNAKMDEIASELFSYVGYKDGSRFIDYAEDDPRLQQLMQQVEQLAAQLESKEQEIKAKMATEQMKQEAEDDRQTQKIKSELAIKSMEIESDEDIAEMNMRAKNNG